MMIADVGIRWGCIRYVQTAAERRDLVEQAAGGRAGGWRVAGGARARAGNGSKYEEHMYSASVAISSSRCRDSDEWQTRTRRGTTWNYWLGALAACR